MTKNKLIIISVDALNAYDYNYIRSLTTFRHFLDNGAHVPEVNSIYPSITYPCHVSIMTGRYPDKHGVFNNEYPDPHKPTTQDWRWFEKNINAPTLFDYAKQHDLTTAAVLWPVMAGADLTWNMPEIWSPDGSTSTFSLLWNNATSNMILPALINSFRLKGKQQPYVDNFSEAIAKHILKKQPDVMAIHLTELDTVRHIYGLHSNEALDALKRIDRRIQTFINITKRNNTYEHTNFVLLGDHGTADFDKVIHINSYLKDKGFITTNIEGKIKTWQAYGCSCGGSCQIHLSNDISDIQRNNLVELLEALTYTDGSPITQLLTKKHAKKLHHLEGDFDYILEAADGYVFRNDPDQPHIMNRSDIPDCYNGDHGYLPEHPDMKSMLLMMGPGIKKGATLESSSIIDEGPTFARLLGFEMDKTDGRVLNELIRFSKI